MRERKELDFLRIVVKDASSLAKRVSLLNFEPRSRSFLVKVATNVAAFTHTTIGSLFFLIFLANVFKKYKIMV